MEFYDLSATKMNGSKVSMEEYRGKVVLVVNTASKCRLTPQFIELEELYNEYKDNEFDVLGFPCNQFTKQDPGSNKEIGEFCLRNYGVSFTMFEKIDVNGQNTHPIYKFLKNEAGGFIGSDIKWNFTKFLIDSEGNVIKRYAPITKPSSIKRDINSLKK